MRWRRSSTGRRSRAEMARLWRAGRAGAGGLAAGAAIAVAVPPFGWWPLGFIGIAAMLHLLDGARWRRRALVGFLVGVAQYAIGALFVAAFSLVGYLLLVVTEAVLVGTACTLVPPRRGRAAALAGALILLEWARDHAPFGGMPLGGLALGQVGGPLLPLARLGGALALAGGVALAGVGIGLLCSPRRRHPRRARVAGACSCAAVAAATAIAGASARGGPPQRTLAAVAVQGGGVRGLTAIEQPGADVFGATLAATARLGRGSAALVLWPEDSVPVTVSFARSGAAAVLSDLARRLDATLIVGVTAPVGRHRFTNALLALAPNGSVVARYEKRHPVPFGEVVPFRGLVSHLVSLAAVPRDMVVGHRVGLLRTPAAPLGGLVSYETFFPGLARSDVRAGARALLVATNTASYAASQVPEEELAASRLNAVATGRVVLQAATTGISAVISAGGVVRDESDLGAPALVRSRLGLRSGRTVYVTFGSAPVLLTGVLALLGGWLLAWRTPEEGDAASAGVDGRAERAVDPVAAR